MKRIQMLIVAAAAALLLAIEPALAQSIDGVRPACGAAGDKVLIHGSDFADAPTVEIGGVEAEVLKSNAERILATIPEGVDAGSATIDVDGATHDDFIVVDDGAPVVLYMSSAKATPGQVLVLIGLRIDGAEAEFIDGDDAVSATVELIGRRRLAAVKVPEDLATGTYTLKITNGDGADTGDCSPEIEIVEAGDATIDEIAPSDQLPGHHLKLTGTDLGPIGPARVLWTDSGGNELKSFGFANGFDTIHTHVPFQATPGEDYDVSATLHDGTTTNTVSYTVGTPGAPAIDSINPAKGPAGSLFGLTGSGFFVFGTQLKVEMTSGDTTLTAKVLFGQPGFLGKGSHLVCAVPSDAADGEYDVTVTVGDQTSDAVTFEVGALPLAVDKMTPDSQGTGGSFRPVVIEGSGFGPPNEEVTVTWSKDEEEREGRVLFHNHRVIVVAPPGGMADPLGAGVWTVTVAVGDSDTEAGEYTVE